MTKRKAAPDPTEALNERLHPTRDEIGTELTYRLVTGEGSDVVACFTIEDRRSRLTILRQYIDANQLGRLMTGRSITMTPDRFVQSDGVGRYRQRIIVDTDERLVADNSERLVEVRSILVKALVERAGIPADEIHGPLFHHLNGTSLHYDIYHDTPPDEPILRIHVRDRPTPLTREATNGS